MSEPLDLDAIETRAQAATPGPWEASYNHVDMSYPADDYSVVTVLTGDTVASSVDDEHESYEEPHAKFGDDAYFIAHARTDVPALISRVRELEPRVLEGDWETVRDALDALPEGAQIRWTTGDPIRISLAIKIINVVGNTRWSATDGRYIPSESIARDETPIEVIA